MRSVFVAIAVATFVLGVCPSIALAEAEVVGVAISELSPFWPKADNYKVDPYIRAASILQKMGKKKAVQKLIGMCRSEKGLDQFKVVILCRMLFMKRAGIGFRGPGLGGPSFLSDTKPEDWPLQPIALVDGVPFLVANGYFIMGLPEDPRAYLLFCLDKCDWNTHPIKPKNKTDRAAALKKLLSMKQLRELEPHERAYLEGQIK